MHGCTKLFPWTHFSLTEILVLAGGTILPAPAVPVSTRVSGRLRCVQGAARPPSSPPWPGEHGGAVESLSLTSHDLSLVVFRPLPGQHASHLHPSSLHSVPATRGEAKSGYYLVSQTLLSHAHAWHSML